MIGEIWQIYRLLWLSEMPVYAVGIGTEQHPVAFPNPRNLL